MSTNREIADKVDRNVKYLSVSRLMFYILTIIAVLLVIVGMFWMLSKVYDIAHSIEDCITPTGNCYKNGDRRSGAAIKTINDNQKQIITVAAYCAKQPGNNTLVQIEACVNKELNR